MSLDVTLYRTVECPHCGDAVPTREEIYEGNITHNLGKMASAANLYMAMWRPEEIGVTCAGQLVPILQAALQLLLASPADYRKLNPSNGWGSYEVLVEFVQKYLVACEENPSATVEVSR